MLVGELPKPAELLDIVSRSPGASACCLPAPPRAGADIFCCTGPPCNHRTQAASLHIVPPHPLLCGGRFFSNPLAIMEKAALAVLFRILDNDRGTEFSAAEAMETSHNGTRRTRVFYCDPMQSGQKGTLENKHIELRYILPKGTDLRKLGLNCQSRLNLVLSHVNSSPCELLGNKSPLELMEFMYQDLYEKLLAFGIHPIEKDQIILRPYLLKQRDK